MPAKISDQALNERAQSLLKALVERFIRDGEPVGSRILAKESGLDLSSASIRNVLSDLEEMGLVRAPHTSAGRVPTAKGYRFFVDTLLTIQPLQEEEVRRMTSGFKGEEVGSQALIDNVSNLLSEVTRMAGVVMLPRRERLGIRQIEFLSLSDNRVLSILMFKDNEIQNRILQLDRKFTPSELQQASNYLNSLFAGRDLMTVRRTLLEDMTRSREHINELMKTAIDMASQVFAGQNKEDYILAGHINLMDFKELASDVDKLRALFDAFNTKRDILHLLDQALTSQGIQIFIGEESGYQVLDECSIITSPYQINDQVVGVLGVIGPTRMAYDRVIPIVDVAAKLLGAALNSRD